MSGAEAAAAVPEAGARCDPAELRRAFGTFATGVTVVTALGEDGRPAGLTVNSFSSVSLDPPLVLWSLSARSPSLPLFEVASHFAINVLAAHQAEASLRFSRPAADKFAGHRWRGGLGGAPLLEECVSWFECRRHARHTGGDHVIFLGEVERLTHTRRKPLVFLHGRYCVPAAHPAAP